MPLLCHRINQLTISTNAKPLFEKSQFGNVRVWASLQQQTEAAEVFHKLQELESIGDITIYEMVLVVKDVNGETSVVQAVTSEGTQLLSGLTIGTLIGSLAGPVGLMLGMVTGSMAGAAAEADDYGFAEDFLSKAANQLQPGTAAVVAEVEEEDPVFVDSSLSLMGATVVRSDVNYEYTKYSDEEMDEFDEDIADAREKLKAATNDEKEKIHRKIDKIKSKRTDRIIELKEKVNKIEADVKASVKERKIAAIRSKIEKHQKKIAELEKKLEKKLEMVLEVVQKSLVQ